MYTTCRLRTLAYTLALSFCCRNEDVVNVEGISGDLTMYGGSFKNGNCGLSAGSLKASRDFVAIGAPIWDKGMKCGQCASVKCVSLGCPDEPRTVMITDQCPECAAGDLDFNGPAYALLTGNMNPDRLRIEWNYVTCPSDMVSGNVDLHLKEGSSVHWFAIQPLNFKETIRSITVQHDSGKIMTLLPPNANSIDSFYFQNDGALASGPLTITLTSIANEKLVKRVNRLWAPRTAISMGAQFQTSSSGQTSAPELPTASVTPTVVPSSTPKPAPAATTTSAPLEQPQPPAVQATVEQTPTPTVISSATLKPTPALTQAPIVKSSQPVPVEHASKVLRCQPV